MASVKVIFRKSKINKNGEAPVVLQIINKRKSYTKNILSLAPKNFNEQKMIVRASFPNASRYNFKIRRMLKEAQDYLLDCEIKGLDPDIRSFFNGDLHPKLADLLQSKIENLRDNNQNRTADKYSAIKVKLMKFDPEVKVDDLDTAWIKKFDSFMESEYGNKPNTRKKELARIKTLTNKTFEGYSFTPLQTHVESLTIQEKEILENYTTDNYKKKMYVDIWLFALYNCGMRAHDVLTLRTENIVNGILSYDSQKGEGKHHEIELSDKSLAIIDRNLNNSEYVFPVVKLDYYKPNKKVFEKHVNAKNALVNKYLKEAAIELGINKKITMHVARHTFTSLMDEMNVSTRLLQSMLGHSKRETTEIYMRKVIKYKEINDVLRGKL